jgi:uncharacterized protein (DUF58 family)
METPLRARLLDPRALARYDALALHVRSGMGQRPGERRFAGHPQPAGIELEAYAPYAPGDDLRHLDWNAVGRLDTLLIRRFTAEREVVVHLLVDRSTSMAEPARDRKLAVACELAMALAYIALSAGDAVRLTFVPADGAAGSGVHRQRASVLPMADRLAGANAGGALALGDALERYARQYTRGVAIVVSDLMAEPADVEHGLLALRARRFEVLLLHVLGRGELEPERELRDGLLRDVESGLTHPIALTPAVIARYRALLDDHLAQLQAIAARTRTTYARLVSDRSVQEFVTVELPRLGVLRRR